MVVRYDYLWASEAAEGDEAGHKRRPCAVVLPLPPSGDGGVPRAAVCGITHSSPRPPAEGIVIPPAVKQHLGLDDDASWIITSEVNVVDWNDPGIVPTPAGAEIYGFMPPSLVAQVVQNVMASIRNARLQRTERIKAAWGASRA